MHAPESQGISVEQQHNSIAGHTHCSQLQYTLNSSTHLHKGLAIAESKLLVVLLAGNTTRLDGAAGLAALVWTPSNVQ
jgi:hypothetical protein